MTEPWISVNRSHKVPVIHSLETSWVGLSDEKSGALRDAVMELMEGGSTCIVLDLSRVERIDSLGIGLLARVHFVLSHVHGSMVAVLPPGFVTSAIRRLHLDKMFPIFEQLEDALAWLHAQY